MLINYFINPLYYLNEECWKTNSLGFREEGMTQLTSTTVGEEKLYSGDHISPEHIKGGDAEVKRIEDAGYHSLSCPDPLPTLLCILLSASECCLFSVLSLAPSPPCFQLV